MWRQHAIVHVQRNNYANTIQLLTFVVCTSILKCRLTEVVLTGINDTQLTHNNEQWINQQWSHNQRIQYEHLRVDVTTLLYTLTPVS